jgi:hypothetical protein
MRYDFYRELVKKDILPGLDTFAKSLPTRNPVPLCTIICVTLRTS